jgi:proteic killer suppression protein
MISGFKHKGLKTFYETGKVKGIRHDQARRIGTILAIMDEADSLEALNRPAMRLHELKGERKGTWAVNVNGPWRITFTFEGGAFNLIDLEQYH